jgi:hypothetical protein
MRSSDWDGNGKTAGEMPTEEDDDQLKGLGPGDALEIWTEGSRIVQTAYNCHEMVNGRIYSWQWFFLDDGNLLEVSPDGYFRYTEHRILKQGSDLYEELVAQDGALVRFEQRVRDNEAGRRPVLVSIDGRQYRIASTGTVSAERRGQESQLLPWNSFSVEPSENVYFGLVNVDDEEQVGLGLWTDHVCLSFGKEFDPTDVTEVYRNRSK